MPEPAPHRIQMIVFNPRLPGKDGRGLIEAMRWNDPETLAAEYIRDLRECSHGRALFQIERRVDVDAFPVKADGFVYTADAYWRSWRSRSGFHQPDLVDYHRLLREFDVVGLVNAGTIDECWLFGFPYAGFYESIMAGPGAVWCNAPPLTGLEAARRRFVVMGFNYERGVGEMLENMGHRAESILAHVFGRTAGAANLWERFSRHDRTHPGRAEVGNVHFAPNSQRDYDWGNRRPVPSRAHTWLNFPDLKGEPRPVDSREWGGGDIREHHRWWFRHLPHAEGALGGIHNNWWTYVVNPNTIP